MLKRIMGAVCCALLFSIPTHTASAQGIPVIDPAAIAKYVEQIQILKQQLDHAKRQFEAVTGTRNLGDILNNPSIRAQLPSDLRLLLNNLESASSSLASSVGNILNETSAQPGDFLTDRQAFQEKRRRLNATSKALNEQSYEMINTRMQEIDGLQAQINIATDPKAIADLQARLTVAQANLTGDKIRLELAQKQIDAEKAMLEEREIFLHEGWFNSENIKGNLH